jgi:hypothetical protein
MAKRNRKQIQEEALQVLEEAEGGIRWSEFLKKVHRGGIGF